ncbi:MAG: hypothetical protein K2N56_05990 [Oscillospiraceae bacterium]|nr:hypothetical protein [Oscillospiraceae bacterium]
MFRKILTESVLAVLMAAALTGCAGSARKNEVTGTNFVYEKDGFPDEFGIRIDDNGTFTYYEGAFSSYVGTGSWKRSGDVLILRERDYSSASEKVRHTYRFKIEDGNLSFISDGSDNFMFINVSDGERFIKKDTLSYYM